MNITYMVPVNGKYVDLKTLPAAEQEKIKANITQRITDAIEKREIVQDNIAS